MMQKIGYLMLFSFLLMAARLVNHEPTSLPRDYPVAQLLESLGDKPSGHKPNLNLEGASIERGRDIVERGMSKANGIRSKRQSKYFSCLACHNKEREDPDLSNPDPTMRLEYVKDKGMPFLQGSPFFGIVNRAQFYNGDYEKKYGELVEPARENLREAIQLCALECSQGRPLKDFELESVLAYLWTLGFKVSDLDFNAAEFSEIERAFDSGQKREAAIKLIKSKYLMHSPATFIDPPKDRITGDNLIGNAKNGKDIYQLSCQYCHYQNEYSFLILDDSELTFKHMANDAPTYKPHSLYQVIRYGTYPKRGKRAYMPQYTKEKMTDQQMADLRAYIDLKAQNKIL